MGVESGVRRCAVVRCAASTMLVNTIEAIVFIQSSSNLVSNFILTKSRFLSIMGHMGSKSRSLGQINEKPCEHSRSHIFEPIFIKLGQ